VLFSPQIAQNPLKSRLRTAFKKAFRLNQSQAFRRAFQIGRRFRRPGVNSYFVNTGLPHGRLGMIIPKKVVKLAKTRHRLKRLIRESFRLNQEKVKGYDIVIHVMSDQALNEAILKENLNQLWQRCKK
jgi:ribonuclease P protein component